MKQLLLLGICSTLALSACGGGAAGSSIPAAAPATTITQVDNARDISGTYRGSFTTSDGVQSELALTLSQEQTTLSGTLEKNSQFGDVSARLSGSLQRGGFYFASGKTGSQCVVTFYSDDESQAVAGTFAASACATNNNTAIRGTFALTKIQ